MTVTGDVYRADDTVREAVCKRLSVIAINYNAVELIEQLASRVWEADAPPLEFIVVDNASEDGSAEQLGGRDDIVLVASPDNHGFGQGCMLGARRAQGDLLLFLNPDLEPMPEMFGALVGNFLAAPSVAISFPKMIAPGEDFAYENKLEDVASMAGAAMLTSRAHLEALGGFDPRIFLYSEETDLCWRTRLRGQRVVQDWQALAVHDAHGTGGGDRWAAEQIRNGLLVHLRLRSWRAVARFVSLMIVKSLVRGVQFRDGSMIEPWLVTARRLVDLLSERRRIRGAADPLHRAELEVLCRANDYWQWYFRRHALVTSVALRLGRRGG